MIVDSFGTMFTFGYYFHECSCGGASMPACLSPLEGAPLTARERECLALAANDLTTDDIASRLGSRHAQLNFTLIQYEPSYRWPLGTSNRTCSTPTPNEGLQTIGAHVLPASFHEKFWCGHDP